MTEDELLNRFSRNEMYLEIEDYIQDMRKMYQTEKNGIYKPRKQMFPDIDMDKGSVAMEIMRYLKQFVETDTKKLECL